MYIICILYEKIHGLNNTKVFCHLVDNELVLILPLFESYSCCLVLLAFIVGPEYMFHLSCTNMNCLLQICCLCVRFCFLHALILVLMQIMFHLISLQICLSSSFLSRPLSSSTAQVFSDNISQKNIAIIIPEVSQNEAF